MLNLWRSHYILTKSLRTCGARNFIKHFSKSYTLSFFKRKGKLPNNRNSFINTRFTPNLVELKPKANTKVTATSSFILVWPLLISLARCLYEEDMLRLNKTVLNTTVVVKIMGNDFVYSGKCYFLFRVILKTFKSKLSHPSSKKNFC